MKMHTLPKEVTPLDFDLLKEKYCDENELGAVLQKIEKGYPVQYAIGDVQFLDFKIMVNENVLIPRFETELLVDKLRKILIRLNFTDGKILDLCTGSGCIAIALSKYFKDAQVSGIDISQEALDLAKDNAITNETEIRFIKKDILTDELNLGKFDVVVSNPPYVKIDEEVSPSTIYEPSIALYPGKDDTLFYRRIIDLCKSSISEKGLIAFEIGSTQGKGVKDYAHEVFPRAKIEIEKDYNGFDRFVFIYI